MSMATPSIHSGLPPSPKGTLLGGNVRQFRAGLLSFLLETAREYGPLASFRIGPRRVFLASGHELIEQVLVTDAKYYIKHFGARAFKPVLGNGLVTSEGDFWLRQRKLAQPAFLKNRVLGYAPIMSELTERMLDRWRDGERVDIHGEFSNLTSAIALKTLFGLDDHEDRVEFVTALRSAFFMLSAKFRSLVRAPLWMPTPRNLR